jgi:hypothetical protein
MTELVHFSIDWAWILFFALAVWFYFSARRLTGLVSKHFQMPLKKDFLGIAKDEWIHSALWIDLMQGSPLKSLVRAKDSMLISLILGILTFVIKLILKFY